MAVDSEWFCVELPNGSPAPGTDGARLPNKEAAAGLARRLAPETGQPLTVVKYSRKEVRTFQRSISVAEADVVSTVPPPA
ncbi:hypothetical protein AS594_07165 [Streptomyces agglomeratus]|uniref:DUF2188 domain-containing protein n=1 Tax=Streptomyces agglomeratus TaxID=285458 RepID=A0A1E5P457_9ACTN|nr:hypothetical protein [Streptomyces agglomeratus]OEJ24302.1 hypothetical protein AS594_07165 [Streptomyces agglomeratus]